DRVMANPKDDRDRLGRSFGCKRGGQIYCSDNSHPTTNQIESEPWYPIVFIFPPSVIDRHISAFVVPGVFEAQSESLAAPVSRNPTTGIVGCARPTIGQAANAPPRSLLNSRRLMFCPCVRSAYSHRVSVSSAPCRIWVKSVVPDGADTLSNVRYAPGIGRKV